MRRTTFKSVVCALGVLTSLEFVSYAGAQITLHAAKPDTADVLPALSLSLSPTSSLVRLSTRTPARVTSPTYSSRPGAKAKLYLDFDGDVTSTWGSYQPGTTPAYDIDGNPGAFSSTEYENIYQIWSGVAEAFSPFDIDITTVNPGTLKNGESLRVVIGGDGKNGADDYWTPGAAGGIGYVGAFYDFHPNTVFVFPGNLRAGTPRFVAMAAAHEAGHAFGLEHHSEYINGVRVQEYSDNDPNTTGDGKDHYSNQPTAPFMGVSYFATRGIWSNGPGSYAFGEQDDLEILSSGQDGFGYRPDDHGDIVDLATALTMTGFSTSAAGVIETIGDRDLFSFTIDSDSTINFMVNGAPYNAMLDPSLALYDASGALLQLVETSALSETLTDLLVAGSYEIGVLSAGQYGDIGQYTLSGLITPISVVPEPVAGMVVLLSGALLRRGNRRRQS